MNSNAVGQFLTMTAFMTDDMADRPVLAQDIVAKSDFTGSRKSSAGIQGASETL